MKRVLLAAVAAMGIMLTGCKEENIRDAGNDGTASSSLTVTIQNQSGNNGANTTRASGTPSTAEEKAVHSFAVYVFNHAIGNIEKSQIFTGTLTGKVSGLSTASNKDIVVLVNYDYTQLSDLTQYNDLLDRTLNIESQNPGNTSNDGLFMSGQSTDVALLAAQENKVTINVSRAVARVSLGSITVSPDATSRLDQFVFKGVSMQKVVPKAHLLGSDIPAVTDKDYVGGLAGDVSQSDAKYNALLYTPYTPGQITVDQPAKPEIYFYVFPNDNTKGNATLMTIEATYMNNPAYYTFVINDEDLGETGKPDGTFIKKNMIYTLHITLRSLSNYVENPDDHDLVDVIVEIDVEDWGEITQNVEW